MTVDSQTAFTHRIENFEYENGEPALNRPTGHETRTATVDSDGWGYQTVTVWTDVYGQETDREEIRQTFVPGEPGETIRAWLPNGRAEPVLSYNPRIGGRVSLTWPADPRGHVVSLARASISLP